MFLFNKILTQLTFAFFGIEEVIWHKIEAQEQQKFNAMSFIVFLISLITFLGMYEFFFLLLNRVDIAIGLGLIFTIILINIIRFSVFTIQKPIYYVPIDIKAESTEDKLTISDTSIATSTTEKPSIVISLANKFINFFGLITTIFFRFIINGILLLFIALPFGCIIKSNDIVKINENRRNELLAIFKKTEEINFNSKCNKLNIKVKHIKSKIQLNNNLIYNTELNNELKNNRLQIQSWEKDKNIRIDNYEKYICDKNFIILSYLFIIQRLSFIICFLFFGLLLFICHYQKYRLVTKSNNSYYKLANKYQYNLVIENYQNTEKMIKEELSKKYQPNKFNIDFISRYESIKNNSFYTNPPFNSIEREYKVPVKELSPIDFISHYGCK